jgi:hypothetical protein
MAEQPDKETAKRYRDILNALIASLPGDEQDEVVTRCCIAVAVEELEKWLYNGEFTPSTVPAEEVTGFQPSLVVKPKAALDKNGKPKVALFTASDDELSLDERDSVERGERELAIRSVSERTSFGWDKAERVVIAYERELAEQEELTDYEKSEVLKGHKITAIRRYQKRRSMVGMDIKKAKHIVNKWERDQLAV